MRRIRRMWRVLTLMVVLVLALMTTVPTGARPSKPTEPAKGYTHTVTVDGSRITSTLSGDIGGLTAEWMFLGPSGSCEQIGEYTVVVPRKATSISQSHDVICPDEAGIWRVDGKLWSRATRVFYDVQYVTVSCDQ